MPTLFKPADLLSLSFLALLCVLAVVAGQFMLLPLYGLLAVSAIITARYATKNRDGKNALYLSTVITVFTVLLIFNSMGKLIAGIQTRRFDLVLIGIDYALFGVHPTVWAERFISPVLTAVLQIAYISYYFIPISLGVTLIARHRRVEFEQALFGIILCFYLSYIGYMLMPAIGPRFTLDKFQTAGLQAGKLITAIQETLNRLEQNKTDAFPSGHTAIALVSLFYAGRFRERTLFAILAPVVIALLLSTVYLRYHYVIDVIAGIALAGLTITVAGPLQQKLSRASRYPGNQKHDAP